jgi:hypothetical protein
MRRSGIGAGLCLAILAGGCGESSRSIEDSGSSGSGGGGSTGGGAGRGGAGGSAGSNTSGSAGQPGGNAGEFFIEGRVDGEVVRVEVGVRAYWFSALNPGYLSVESLTDGLGWVIRAPNYDGADSCGAATITLMDQSGDQTRYYVSDPFVEIEHGCALLVERAAPNVGDIIEGTFSGALTPLPGDANAPVTVTEGAFRAPRVADNPPP